MDLEPIERLTEQLSRNLRRLDERRLNEALETASSEALRNAVRRRLPPTSRRREVFSRPENVPESLRRAMRDIGLLDETDPERRVRLFTGYCRYRNYTYNTVLRYFKILRTNGAFDGCGTLRPDRLAFVDSGRAHERAIDMASFARLVAHLNENFSRYTAPLLVAVHTGLRVFEILQWSAMTILQLRRRELVVSIARKRTFLSVDADPDTDKEYWRPVYTTHLQHFVDQMERLYAEELRALREHGADVKLFPVTHRTLVNRIRQAFLESNGFAAPRGFGVHSCRNMIATLMARNTDNIVAIRSFLQHRNVSTTRRYVNADFRHMRAEFDRLTRNELATVRRDLRPRDADDANANDDDVGAKRSVKRVKK